ncbi:KISS1R [Branchiostoma lanceolatum]|uniref:KISS1R protein n=1 Tax=Branchiostoma lanceolatum TaxID=7740 RepID=A0A8J9W3R1_BRALA|nr:KISS1R [Branchiostoma lanceolatum]
MRTLLNCTGNATSSDSMIEEVSNSSCTRDVAEAGKLPLPVPMSWDHYVPPAIFAFIFLVGLTGNSLVIYVVAFFRKMRTVTNFYLCNLAVADMTFLLCCVPFTAAQYAMPSWVFGEHMCKMVNYMMQVTVQATCLTLAAVGVDRYCAIVHPVASLIFRRKRVAISANVLIWIVSFLMALPVPLHYRLVEWNWSPYGWQTICRPVWPSKDYEKGIMIYTFLSTYFIPQVVCLISCVPIIYRLWHRFDNVSVSVPRNNAEKTRKSTFMVLGAIILFTVCWLPNHVINLWWHSSSNKQLTAAVYYSKFVGICLSYANSALNPFVYAMVGDSFRECIKQTCSQKQHQRPPPDNRRTCRQKKAQMESRLQTYNVSGVLGSTTKTQLYVTSKIEKKAIVFEAESSV